MRGGRLEGEEHGVSYKEGIAQEGALRERRGDKKILR